MHVLNEMRHASTQSYYHYFCGNIELLSCFLFAQRRKSRGNSPGIAKITVYHVCPEAQVSWLCEQGELHMPSFNHSGNCSQLALTFVS